MTVRHALGRLLCAEDGADRVDREDAPHPLEFKVLQQRLLCEDRGVVHQHIDPTEGPVDRGEQLNDLLRICAVCAHGQSPAPSSLHISRDREGGRLVGNKAYSDIVTLCGSEPRRRRAYATASTRYQNDRHLRDGCSLSQAFMWLL